MRRLVWWLVILLAAACLGVSVATLLIVDRDDVLRTPTRSIDLTGAVGIRSGSGLLAVSGLRLVVEARSAQGVLVAGAHPVDARAWLGGRPTRAITAVGWQGLSVSAPSAMAGPLAAPAAPAASTPDQPPASPPSPPDLTAKDVWVGSAAGPGWQRVEFVLDGSPLTVLAVPTTFGAPVELRLGAHVPGARTAAWVLLMVAALLTVGLGVRSRRRAQSSSGGSGGEGAAPAGSVAPGVPPGRPRGTLFVAGVLSAGTLAGCVGPPRPVAAWDDAKVRKQALSGSSVRAVLETYDVRNNAAIDQTRASGDPGAWAGPDDGMLLEWDVMSTRLARARDPIPPAVHGHHTGQTAYAPTFDAYPMWALVPATSTWQGGEPAVVLTLLRKQDVTAPWRAAATAAIGTTRLPDPAVGTGGDVTSGDIVRAVTAAKDVRLTLRGGPDKGSIALAGDLSVIDRARSQQVGDAAQLEMSTTFHRGTDEDQQTGQSSVRVVRTADGGLLALAMYTHTTTVTARPGQTFSFKDQGYAKAVAAEGDLTSVMVRASCAAALVLPPGRGQAFMAGSSCRDIV